MKKETTKIDITSVICALTHNLDVCERCKKCPGKNFAEIRFNIVEALPTLLKGDRNGL